MTSISLWESGSLFLSSADGSGNDACASYIGRDCMASIYEDSDGYQGYTDVSFLSGWSNLTIAECQEASEIVSSVPTNAGATL